MTTRQQEHTVMVLRVPCVAVRRRGGEQEQVQEPHVRGGLNGRCHDSTAQVAGGLVLQVCRGNRLGLHHTQQVARVRYRVA